MKSKNLHRLLIGITILKIISFLAIFTVLSLFIIDMVTAYLTLILWSLNQKAYNFLRVIQYRIVPITIIYFLAGYCVILYFILRKHYLYFVTVLEAVDSITNESSELIEIPYPELTEVSRHINTIKSELQRNVRAAKEAEQKKNDLVVYLAHDLKTPLTSVIGYITLLKDEKEISKGLQSKYLQITLDKAKRLEDLINEFFEITRFNLTRPMLEMETTNFTRLLEQLVNEFKPIFIENKVTCRLEVPKDLHLSCDVIKMQRVLDNLLNNAVNYSYKDSVITIIVEIIDNFVEIRFTNQGHTIPSEKLEIIFEQFFRIDQARRSTTGGAGLGLAIAKEIVTLHGGSIQAKSEEQYTTFIIRIPE